MALNVGETGQKYISRITYPYAGYVVALPLPGRPGSYKRKRFFGVRLTAGEYLAAAVKWRDEEYFALYGKEVPNRVFHARQGNSNTGIPGVNKFVKVVKKKRKDGTVGVSSVPCIRAEIDLAPGANYVRSDQRKTRVFSIAKYGEAEAIRLAKLEKRYGAGPRVNACARKCTHLLIADCKPLV